MMACSRYIRGMFCFFSIVTTLPTQAQFDCENYLSLKKQSFIGQSLDGIEFEIKENQSPKFEIQARDRRTKRFLGHIVAYSSAVPELFRVEIVFVQQRGLGQILYLLAANHIQNKWGGKLIATRIGYTAEAEKMWHRMLKSGRAQIFNLPMEQLKLLIGYEDFFENYIVTYGTSVFQVQISRDI